MKTKMVMVTMMNIPWPIGAMTLRVSDFHFPISIFHLIRAGASSTAGTAMAVPHFLLRGVIIC